MLIFEPGLYPWLSPRRWVQFVRLHRQWYSLFTRSTASHCIHLIPCVPIWVTMICDNKIRFWRYFDRTVDWKYGDLMCFHFPHDPHVSTPTSVVLWCSLPYTSCRIALWERQLKIVIPIGLLCLAHWALLWRGMFIVDAAYDPTTGGCVVTSTNHVFLNLGFFMSTFSSTCQHGTISDLMNDVGQRWDLTWRSFYWLSLCWWGMRLDRISGICSSRMGLYISL